MFKTLAPALIASLALLTLSGAANAEFLCAVTRSLECNNLPGNLDCMHHPATASYQPTFLAYDLKEKRITGTYVNAEDETTIIHTVKQVNDQFLLSGIDGNTVWSSVISINTGRMTTTIADSALVIVLYGNCTVP
jgi:hypothetical protein